MLKNNITLRLCNICNVPEDWIEGKNYVSAEKYGFDDLVIVPYTTEHTTGQFLVRRLVLEDIEKMGYTTEKLVDEVLKRTQYKIMDIENAIMDAGGFPEGTDETMTGDSPFTVVNASDGSGAIGVIPATRELKERFPSGYIVIPSSINEVLILPISHLDNANKIAQIIGEVNMEVLRPNEVLSYKYYVFT